MNTTTMLFLPSAPAMSTSPCRTYARVGVRDPARMYTYVAVFSFLHPGRLYYDTCVPLHPPIYMYVHVRDQNDNVTYASTRWVLTVRHFLACEDVAGGSQQSGGRNTVARPVGPRFLCVFVRVCMCLCTRLCVRGRECMWSTETTDDVNLV